MGGCLVVDDVKGTSEKLLLFIQGNPGCHLRRIRTTMGVSMGTVQYQLDKLEKMGKVTSTRRGLYKYYFPAGLFKENEKEILEVLTHETARKMLLFIIEQKNPTQTDIANSLKISAIYLDIKSNSLEISADEGKVVVTWWERSQTTNEPVIRISSDGGKTFGPLLKLASDGKIGG
jgi:predicted transcriptional regulator